MTEFHQWISPLQALAILYLMGSLGGVGAWTVSQSWCWASFGRAIFEGGALGGGAAMFVLYGGILVGVEKISRGICIPIAIYVGARWISKSDVVATFLGAIKRAFGINNRGTQSDP